MSDSWKICADLKSIPFQIFALQNREVHSAFVVVVFEEIVAESAFVGKTAFFDYAPGRLVYRARAYLHFMQTDFFKAVADESLCCFCCIAALLKICADAVFNLGKVIFAVNKKKRNLSCTFV